MRWEIDERESWGEAKRGEGVEGALEREGG